MIIKLTLELTEQAAEAYAQHLKQSTYDDYRSTAASDGEARQMIAAANEIRAELAREGFAPR